MTVESREELLRGLTHGEAHVWIAADGICGVVRENLEALLDPEEDERYRGFQFEAPRVRYLATHALLRTTLSRYHPVDPRDWGLETARNQPPRVRGPSFLPGLKISLSRTEGLVAVLLSTAHHCGVDVERERPVEGLEGTASRVMQRAELDAYEPLEGDARRERFFHLWTLKEAYVKSVGLGMMLPLRSVFFDVSREETEMRHVASPDEPARGWQLFSDRPTAAHRLSAALCWPGGGRHPVRVFLASPGLVDLQPRCKDGRARGEGARGLEEAGHPTKGRDG